MKIEILEKIPREMVGDGKSPNVYFVSTLKNGVVLITRDWELAYNYWRGLPDEVQPSLEDRQTGVLCSVDPDETEDSPYRRIDDIKMLSAKLRRQFAHK